MPDGLVFILAALVLLGGDCTGDGWPASAGSRGAKASAASASAVATRGLEQSGQLGEGPGSGAIPAPVATPLPTTTPPVDPSRGPAVPVYRGRTDSNAVALTFDAGADAGYTALILETLRRNSVSAAFGMTGQWAQAHPELVRQMVADGHQLMNHTWDHRSLTGVSTKTRPLDREGRWAELDRTEAFLYALTGQTTLPYFRAPFGDDDRSVEVDAGLRGYRYDVLWTVDSGGWAGAPVSRIIATCARGAAPGAIVVMHVGTESQDGPALQGVIDAIRARGLGFATVAELVGDE